MYYLSPDMFKICLGDFPNLIKIAIPEVSIWIPLLWFVSKLYLFHYFQTQALLSFKIMSLHYSYLFSPSIFENVWTKLDTLSSAS